MSIVKGGVTIERPGTGKVTDVKPGAELLVGDVITIGEGADAQLVLPDSAFVNLAPGASLRVNQYSFDPGSEKRMVFVRLMRGKARFVVYNRMSHDSAVIVETDSARVTASGTVDFVMNVMADATETLALSGFVRVNNSSDFVVGTVSLGENLMTIVKAKTPPSGPVAMNRRQRKEYIRRVRQSR
ncbi:MAG: FecR domain-containing protein [Deltaproteobacteria bacterium]|nr:FecR domain-containing protein [Deltaproteobacteria bacterium]